MTRTAGPTAPDGDGPDLPITMTGAGQAPARGAAHTTPASRRTTRPRAHGPAVAAPGGRAPYRAARTAP
ncbi:hypothetical protein [Streptomyces yaizuensis]|uniref:Uncharacterized protein n=1 Tax=Streptomyces yaizuensis TaxID=2989713 RepID=A0ABQ5P3C4_9ACTN|nr:hypothetical protein [Streptomyces sp. YSPA8]GLF97092.1 hypothetical protein SYYSPA8_22365 [Streptomyces sp. YSPA8]